MENFTPYIFFIYLLLTGQIWQVLSSLVHIHQNLKELDETMVKQPNSKFSCLKLNQGYVFIKRYFFELLKTVAYMDFMCLYLFLKFEVLDLQDELSVSGSGTVVVRSPRGYQSSIPFSDQSSLVCDCVVHMIKI